MTEQPRRGDVPIAEVSPERLALLSDRAGKALAQGRYETAARLYRNALVLAE